MSFSGDATAGPCDGSSIVFTLLVCSVLAQAPSTASGERSATLVEERPTTAQLRWRAVVAPLSAVMGTGTGIGIGLGIGYGLGLLVDAISPPRGAPPPLQLFGSVLAAVGVIIGGVIGYLLGTIGPGGLYETAVSARKRAIPFAALITVIAGAAWLIAGLTGVLVAALPWLIVGSAALSIAVPILGDATRPRVEGVSLVVF